MDIFGKFDAVSPLELKQCVALWEAYRSVKSVREAERHIAVQAFNYLYAHGDEEGAFLAESALSRLNERPKEARLGTRTQVREAEPGAGTSRTAAKGPGTAKEARTVKVEEAPRELYVPREVSSGERKRARELNDRGYQLAKKKKYDEALTMYEKAIDTDPGLEIAIYNAACMYALTNRDKTALEYLQRLQDLNTVEGNDRLHKARIDRDLESLRPDPLFKRLTGYAKIKLINSIGEYGEDEVERIEKYLGKAKHEVAEYGTDKHEREAPILWYQNNVTAMNTAYVLQRLVNHPNSLMYPIDWDTDYDIIISWGDKITRDPNGNVQVPPVHEVKDPEKTADEALAEQDKALRKPDEYSRKVEHAANTPDRIQSKGEGSVRRVEDTMNRMEKAGKAVEKFGSFGK